MTPEELQKNIDLAAQTFVQALNEAALLHIKIDPKLLLLDRLDERAVHFIRAGLASRQDIVPDGPIENCHLCQVGRGIICTEEEQSNFPRYYVKCSSCAYQTKVCVSKEKAISLWNSASFRRPLRPEEVNAFMRSLGGEEEGGQEGNKEGDDSR